MGMKRKIAKGLAYATFPKGTFAALNPGKAVLGKAAAWAIDQAMPERKRNHTRRNLMSGVAAAVVAIPVGVWLGRTVWAPTGTDVPKM